MVELRDINLKFKENRVLDNFSLEIKKGEKILLKGPSGTGKTTILKIILGFVKPDSGKLLYKGDIVNKENIWKIREDMSYISQDVDFPKIEVIKIIENIFNYKVNKDIELNKKNLYSELEKYKLEKSILKKNVKSISGGERQRIAIIISKLLNKELYLLDEITSALDPELKKIVTKNLVDSKKTIIAISHDDVFQKSDHFRVVNLGGR